MLLSFARDGGGRSHLEDSSVQGCFELAYDLCWILRVIDGRSREAEDSREERRISSFEGVIMIPHDLRARMVLCAVMTFVEHYQTNLMSQKI